MDWILANLDKSHSVATMARRANLVGVTPSDYRRRFSCADAPSEETA